MEELEILDVELDSDYLENLSREDESSLVNDPDRDVEQPDTTLACLLKEVAPVQNEVKKIPDTHGKLQHYYAVISGKVSPEVAQIVVWEGAAKNRKIKSGLSDVVDEDSVLLGEDETGYIAKLFSNQLNSEQKRGKSFLPAFKAIATCEWEGFRGVAIYMLAMLLHKLPESGMSMVTDTLPSKDYYRVFGNAVIKDSETRNWPKFIVRMPKPNRVLSPEQFRELLEQDINDLGKKGNVSWILLFSYSPENTGSEIASKLDDIRWSNLLFALSVLIEFKGHYDQEVVKNAKVRLVKAWGEASNLEQRIASVKNLKQRLDHNAFEKLLKQIISVATYPLDDFKGDKDEPCLLVTSFNPQFAVKLFKHTMRTLVIDIEKTVRSLVRQKIKDRTLAAVVREMARLKVVDDELADELLYSCSSEKLLQSCAELLRIAPNPRTHPFMEILEVSDEKTCFKALELLSPDLYTPNCSPDDINALHLTASFGYTSVVKEILARGFHRLLDESGRSPITIDDCWDGDDLRPASLAVQATHFVTAKELLQAMEPEDAKTLCTLSGDNEKPEINLHKVMDEISKRRGARWDNNVKEEGEWKTVLVRLEKKEVQERVEFMQTALDATVESRHVDLSLLIQDQHGMIPDQFSSGRIQSKQDLETAKKKAGKPLYRKIAQSECEDLISHECFSTLTNIIWIDYGIVQGVLFSLYLLFMAFLTTSLVLAARISGDPSQYESPLDWFRLFCEIVTLVWILLDLVLEFYELGRVIHRSVKRHTHLFQRESPSNNGNGTDKTDGGGSDDDGSSEGSKEEEEEDKEEEEDEDDDEDENGGQGGPQHLDEDSSNCCIGLIKDVLTEYFLDWQNMLDDLAILCILLIIPFRVVDSDNQWVFAALAFMFHGLRIFKYAIMFKSVGEYVAILVLLIKRDIPQFVTVFLVIIFSLGGALYLALIGHYGKTNVDTENNNETSEIYFLWWTGVRILAEGSALTYYGPGGFNWLGILIYWLFLFIVVVVLLNILIAQFSKSYEEESERAQINVIRTRTEIILKMEQSALTRPCIRFVRRKRLKFSKKCFEYEKVKRQSFAGEREEDKAASSEQVEELQTQTTHLGLQLRKQMDDNSGKNVTKVEEMKTEIVRETREALKDMKEEMEGKMVGVERVVIDTRKYVDEIKELLLSMKEKMEP